jgi:hypothetical protein
VSHSGFVFVLVFVFDFRAPGFGFRVGEGNHVSSSCSCGDSATGFSARSETEKVTLLGPVGPLGFNFSQHMPTARAKHDRVKLHERAREVHGPCGALAREPRGVQPWEKALFMVSVFGYGV